LETSGAKSFFISDGLANFKDINWVTTRSSGEAASSLSRVSMFFDRASGDGTILVTSPALMVV
jgi:hypothetical protein